MTKKAHTIYLTVIALLLVGWLVPIGPSPAGVVRVGGKKVTILEKTARIRSGTLKNFGGTLVYQDDKGRLLGWYKDGKSYLIAKRGDFRPESLDGGPGVVIYRTTRGDLKAWIAP
jgi:hypothetical protein